MNVNVAMIVMGYQIAAVQRSMFYISGYPVLWLVFGCYAASSMQFTKRRW